MRGHEPQHLLFALGVLRELVVAQLSKVSVKYAKISQSMPKIWSNFPKFPSKFRTRRPANAKAAVEVVLVAIHGAGGVEPTTSLLPARGAVHEAVD